MTIEEAYAEMKRRGWGFSRNGRMIAVGKIMNPDYEEQGQPPLIEVYAMGIDPADTVQRAILKAEENSR